MSHLHTTREAAAITGKTYDAVRKQISLYPWLKPAEKFGRSLAWTDEEIERLKGEQ